MNKISKETNIAFSFIITVVIVAYMVNVLTIKEAALHIVFILLNYCLICSVVLFLDGYFKQKRKYDQIKGGECFYENSEGFISVSRPTKRKTTFVTENDFKPNKKYHCYHAPTMEEWVVLGVSKDFNYVCVAGWPPSIAQMQDCSRFEEQGDLTDEEKRYRDKQFGNHNWL